MSHSLNNLCPMGDQINLYSRKYEKYVNMMHKHKKIQQRYNAVMKGGGMEESNKLLRDLDMMYRHIGSNLLNYSLAQSGKNQKYENQISGIKKANKEQFDLMVQQMKDENEKMSQKLNEEINTLKADLKEAKQKQEKDPDDKQYQQLVEDLRSRIKTIYSRYIQDAEIYFKLNQPQRRLVSAEQMLANCQNRCNNKNPLNFLLNKALDWEKNKYETAIKKNIDVNKKILSGYGPIKVINVFSNHILNKLVAIADQANIDLNISLLKDTSEMPYNIYNSSVTFGAAIDYYKKNPDSKDRLLVLNCGTGDIKYQLYTKLPDGKIIYQWEADIKKMKGLQKKATLGDAEKTDSDKQLVISKVNTTNDKTPNNLLIESIENDLRVILDYLNTNLSVGADDINIMALITGSTREKYELTIDKFKLLDIGEENKGSINNDPEIWWNYNIKYVFDIVGENLARQIIDINGAKPNLTKHGERFFITQEQEGMFEVLAVSELAEGVFGKDKIVVVGACGIGKGSTQIQFKNFDDIGITAPKISTTLLKPNTQTPVSLGMNNIDKLLAQYDNTDIIIKVPETPGPNDHKNFAVSDMYGKVFAQRLDDNSTALKEYFEQVSNKFPERKIVIGLKSGFLLPFEADRPDNIYCNAIMDLYTSGCRNIGDVIAEEGSDVLDLSLTSNPSISSSSYSSLNIDQDKAVADANKRRRGQRSKGNKPNPRTNININVPGN